MLFTNLATIFVGMGLYFAFLGLTQFVQISSETAGYGFGATVLEASVVYLLPGALTGFVIALISFMEVMASAKVIALRTRTRWDENQELIGQGLAKIAAGFCQSMPVSGSFSRSALNLSVGARTGEAFDLEDGSLNKVVWDATSGPCAALRSAGSGKRHVANYIPMHLPSRVPEHRVRRPHRWPQHQDHRPVPRRGSQRPCPPPAGYMPARCRPALASCPSKPACSRRR